MSGARDDRPELAALLDQTRRRDVLVVWRLDRLGRSLPHLLAVASDLQDRGVELREHWPNRIDGSPGCFTGASRTGRGRLVGVLEADPLGRS